ncbi:CHASE2 domain-containing protein [Nitrospirota bacterium]
MNRSHNMNQGKLKPAHYALIAGLLTGLLVCIVFSLGVLEPLELKSLDHRFVRYADRLTPSDDIVIVTIDQNSIDYMKNELHILWKWPRDVYAYTIDYLTHSGARAVLLDLAFQDPDINRAEFEEGQTDILLGESIGESGVVITTAPFSAEKQTGRYDIDATDYDTLKEFSIHLNSAEDMDLDKAARVEAPITTIMENSRLVGYPNVLAEVDGVIRRLRLLMEYDSGIYPSTALATAMTSTGTNEIKVDAGYTLILGDMSIPIGRNAGAYLNWYGPGGPGPEETFKYYPISNVFLSQLFMQDGQPPLIQEDAFRDKIVLIGSNAPSLFDLKPTPMSGHGPYPGVEILATAINNLLEGTTLVRESSARAILTTLLVCMLLTIALIRAKSPLKSVPLVIVSLVAYYIYAVAAFHANVFVNLVPAGTGIALTFMTITLLDYLTEGREKARVKKAFSQYTSSALMEEILKDPKMLKLGGEKRDLSILFSDIRSFTSISEQLEPEQLTHILNDYLTPMTDVVFRHKGILDKYIGDAIMAIFGAPLPIEDHPSAACNTALDMIAELEALRRKWKEMDLPEFIQNMKIGIGINSGPVSVGNMGSNLRFDYTVIGDNVNLSSRLEGTTKVYGVSIIVSQNTWERTRNEFIFRELDFIKVKGKQKPIRVYELMGRMSGRESDSELLQQAKTFAFGLKLYRDRRWQEAEDTFRGLTDKDPWDKASAVYIERCREFMKYPPNEDWDGVFERRSK